MDAQWIDQVPCLPARRADGHKGDFGRVLVLGGSVGMAGAPSLATLAALRGGAGLVTAAVPMSIQPGVAVLCPCATTVPLPESVHGRIEPTQALKVLSEHGLLPDRDASRVPDVLVAGPGLGRGDASFERELWTLMDAFRLQAGVPVVLDADALNAAGAIGGAGAWDQRPAGASIWTPHPGEMARLHGVGVAAVQADREGYALRTARALARRAQPGRPAPVVVLKGAGTLVTDGERIYRNTTGNPGMATGGTGDVLAGLIGALIGQRLDLFEAAVLAVYLHGLAGDLAAEATGPVSLIATDLLEWLPAAFMRS